VPPADHDRGLAFWQEVSGLPCASRPGIPSTTGTELHGQEFELLVQRLGDGPAWVHLDVHTDAVEAE
jgi:hypothetical protein